MTDLTQSIPAAGITKPPPNPVVRVARYVLVKAVLLLVMVAIGIYLAVVVVNYGGYIDKIYQAQINDLLMGYFMNTDTSMMTQEEQTQLYDQMEWDLQEAFGLHEPFLLRSLRWSYQGITLNWGQSRMLETQRGESRQVKDIIFEALPNTLLLAGSANVLVFISSVLAALFLAKRYGGWWDRLILSLSPLSTIPNWIYAVLLIVIFASQLNLLPYGGMYDSLPPATRLGYVPIVLKHMLLPILAIILSMFFQSVYAWRTYFLIYQGEDYVEMAIAKGLSEREINTRYILRPILPYLVTNFAFLIIGFWQGVIVLEKVFNWPGIGQLFIKAVPINDRNVVIALIVIFAYLLAASIFILDITYALLDPRIRIGGESQTVKPVKMSRKEARLAGRQSGFRQPKHSFAKPEPGQVALPPGQAAESQRKRIPRSRVGALRTFAQEVVHYPLAVLGLAIIAVMVLVAVYTVVALPYDEAVYLWRGNRPEGRLLPENARPVWINLFRLKDLPPNIVLSSRDGTADKEVIPPTPEPTKTTLFIPYIETEEQANAVGEGEVTKAAAPAAPQITMMTLSYTFEYPYGDFPKDLSIDFVSNFIEKRPFVTLTWLTPDGRELNLGGFSIKNSQSYVLSLDAPKSLLDPKKNQQKFLTGGSGGHPPVEILFANPNLEQAEPMRGTYTLRIDGMLFEQGTDLDATLILYGKVYGLAGTDHMRRDLMVALLWGTPIALAFGFLGAIGTTLASMMLAAIGVWFGGWVDQLIQRLTDVNMMIPVLPVAIMVFYIYSQSIWMILAVVVILNVFSSILKNYRSAFLQMKEAPYIEAAQAYGCSNWRIIFRYLVPRILPLLVPQLIILIPTYVCFEGTLAFLNVSEPNAPTWGKVIYDALEKGAYQGNLYWVLEPVGLMVLTGLSFAMVGFALDRIFNPRLRTL